MATAGDGSIYERERPSFSCCAGVATAVVDVEGDVFLCQNFMNAPKQIRLGNVYEGLDLASKFFDCSEEFCACPMYKFDPELFKKAIRRRDGLHISDGMDRPFYDVWLHWYVTEECFLQCDYCATGARMFNKKMVREIDIPRLLATLEASNLKFRISFTGGGEPMVVPNIIEACIAITGDHYLSLNTNLVARDMRPFAEKIDPAKVVEIVASLHLHELERTKNIDRYIDNFLMCKNAGHPIWATAVATPAIFADLDRFQQIFRDAGIVIGFAPFNGIFEGRSYPNSYTKADRIRLGFDTEIVDIHIVDKA